jgi:hypothetical protein
MVHQHLRKTNLAFHLHQFRSSPHSTRRPTYTFSNRRAHPGRCDPEYIQTCPVISIAYHLTNQSRVFVRGILEPGVNARRAGVEPGSRFHRYLFVVRTSFSEPVMIKSTSGLPGMYSLQVYLVAPNSSEKVYKHGYYRPF